MAGVSVTTTVWGAGAGAGIIGSGAAGGMGAAAGGTAAAPASPPPSVWAAGSLSVRSAASGAGFGVCPSPKTIFTPSEPSTIR